MKKLPLILAAGPVALALAACSESTTNVEEGETATMTDPGTAAVTGETSTTAPLPGETGDRVTISPDGVTADVGDGSTRVRADVDNDPSLTVERD